MTVDYKRAENYKRIESLFFEARQASRPTAIPADLILQSADDAYRIQDQVFARLWPGERPAAWKAGAASDKVEPMAAPIHTVLQSPASLPAAGMHMIGVEAEIAFRLARDLPPRLEPYCEEEVASAVGEALVAIEICDTRLANWKGAPLLWKLADFHSNFALVAGSGTSEWRALDFTAQRVELRLGERTIAATGAHPFGNPIRLMPWIAAHCMRRSGGLRAGDIVTTGSWTGLEFARPGDEIAARFPGIGEASARIA